MTETTALLLLLGALTLADHASTVAFLRRGIAEANPLLARVIARYGATGLLVVKLALYGAVWLAHLYTGPLVWQLVAALCVAYAAVIVWNVIQILRRG